MNIQSFAVGTQSKEYWGLVSGVIRTLARTMSRVIGYGTFYPYCTLTHETHNKFNSMYNTFRSMRYH